METSIKTAIPRGRCPDCRNVHRLRQDGTMMAHARRIYVHRAHASVTERCTGMGQLPVPLKFDNHFGLPDCVECCEHFSSTLVEAVYSVAIENGKDPEQMLRDYLTAYHVAEHTTSGPPWNREGD